jgi:hypothetical protein
MICDLCGERSPHWANTDKINPNNKVKIPILAIPIILFPILELVTESNLIFLLTKFHMELPENSEVKK